MINNALYGERSADGTGRTVRINRDTSQRQMLLVSSSRVPGRRRVYVNATTTKYSADTAAV